VAASLSSAAAGETELQGVLADLWPLLCHSLQNEHYTRDQVLAATRAALPLMQRVLPVFNAPVVSTSSDEAALPNDRRLRQVHRALKELSEGCRSYRTRWQRCGDRALMRQELLYQHSPPSVISIMLLATHTSQQ